MKKQQKIIEIRTSAKVKLENLKAEMKTAIAIAAQTHADILAGRTDKCDNERFNEIERFKAEKLTIEADFYKKKADLYAECEQQCAAAEDDPEPDKEQPQPKQETVYCDGSEHSARIAARRLINKMPHIPEGGSISVMISRGEGDLGDRYWFSACTTNGTHLPDGSTAKLFDEYNHNANSEAEYVNIVRALFDARKEGCNE